ncbi:hypothetical protein SDC9_150870 [bioreactor metagenome]|uniref:Uncharacterized protein n=1 Tax=bioreactor metagenome TaxID=1076179 RepID=A0A645ER65_9ZZZZ
MLKVIPGEITAYADTPEEMALETLDVIGKIFSNIGRQDPEAAEIYRRRLMYGMIHPRALTCSRAQPAGTVALSIKGTRHGIAVCIVERGGRQ